jgi:hypothetical protein
VSGGGVSGRGKTTLQKSICTSLFQYLFRPQIATERLINRDRDYKKHRYYSCYFSGISIPSADFFHIALLVSIQYPPILSLSQNPVTSIDVSNRLFLLRISIRLFAASRSYSRLQNSAGRKILNHCQKDEAVNRSEFPFQKWKKKERAAHPLLRPVSLQEPSQLNVIRRPVLHGT